MTVRPRRIMRIIGRAEAPRLPRRLRVRWPPQTSMPSAWAGGGVGLRAQGAEDGEAGRSPSTQPVPRSRRSGAPVSYNR